MSIFKVGDKVRIINNRNGGRADGFELHSLGAIGEIVQILKPWIEVLVKGERWCYYESQLELVDENETKITETAPEIIDITKELGLKDTEYSVPAHIFSEGRDLLKATYHSTNYWDDALNESQNAKSWLCNLLSRHPNWDANRQAIVLNNVEYTRDFDGIKVREILQNLKKEYENKIYEDGDVFKNTPYSYRELRNTISKLKRIINFMCDNENSISSVTYKGTKYTLEEICNECDRIESIYNSYSFYTEYDGHCISKETANKICAFDDIMRTIYECDNLDEFLPENVINGINGRINNSSWANKNNIKVSFRKEQRITKIIDRLAKIFGFDKYVKMGEKINPTTGEVKKVDFGWKKYRAELGDAAVPKKYKQRTIISLNQIDYLTMSNGANWSSCHMIDPDYKVFKRNDNSYSGCYMAGTLSYMADGATIIMYTLKDDAKSCLAPYTDEVYELCPKMRRACIHMAQDLSQFIFSRIYPDGRDGGDGKNGLPEQWAKVFMNAIDKCVGKEMNYAELDMKDMCAINDVGCHYKDYRTYPDTYMYRSNIYYENNTRGTIKIGQMPIYLDTGNEHEGDNEDCAILEEDKLDRTECDNCGNYYDSEYTGYYIDRSGGYNYCCMDCANAAGWHELEDSFGCYNWYWSDEIVYCEDENENGIRDEAIGAEDSCGDIHWYTSEEKAYYYGCECIDGTWYTEDAWRYCEECESPVPISEWDEEHDCCKKCGAKIEAEMEADPDNDDEVVNLEEVA